MRFANICAFGFLISGQIVRELWVMLQAVVPGKAILFMTLGSIAGLAGALTNMWTQQEQWLGTHGCMVDKQHISTHIP